MSNLKKVLGALLSATVLVTSGAMMASAENQSLISKDPSDWSYDDSVMKVESTDGALVFSNTNGQWPDAHYTGDSVSIASTAKIAYDFTVEAGASTNITLFFKDATPDDFTGKDDQYIGLQKLIDGITLNGDDLVGDGTAIKGELDLSKIPASCYNDDGTLTLNSVKVFAVGDAGKKVTIRDLSVVAGGNGDDANTDSTDSAAPTTAAPAGTTKKASPATGESTAMVASGIVLAVVSAGAVALTMKKKAQ